MKRILGVCIFALSLTAMGCGKPATTADAGTDDPSADLKIKVSGAVLVHPRAVDYLKSLTPPKDAPSVADQTFKIQEPFLAFTKSPDAVLATIEKVPADGKYSVADVPTKPIVLGLIGTLSDARTGAAKLFAGCASPLFEGKPTADLADTKTYALPVSFIAKLTTATGGDPAVSDLEKQGAILGQVVDATGKPVADLVVAAPGKTPDQIKYIKADYSGVQDKTSANGLFVIPGKNDPVNFTVSGHEEYGTHKAGSSEGSIFNLTFKSK